MNITYNRQLCLKQFLYCFFGHILFIFSLFRPAFAHIGRASDDFGLKFKSFGVNGERPGIVRCLKSALNFRKSLNKSDDARRCFMSRKNITPDLPFLNIHYPFTNKRITYASTNIVACLWSQKINLLSILATCLRAWL